MLNPFFQQGSKTEQSLVQDLINEQLKYMALNVIICQENTLLKNSNERGNRI